DPAANQLDLRQHSSDGVRRPNEVDRNELCPCRGNQPGASRSGPASAHFRDSRSFCIALRYPGGVSQECWCSAGGDRSTSLCQTRSQTKLIAPQAPGLKIRHINGAEPFFWLFGKIFSLNPRQIINLPPSPLATGLLFHRTARG